MRFPKRNYEQELQSDEIFSGKHAFDIFQVLLFPPLPFSPASRLQMFAFYFSAWLRFLPTFSGRLQLFIVMTWAYSLSIRALR